MQKTSACNINIFIFIPWNQMPFFGIEKKSEYFWTKVYMQANPQSGCISTDIWSFLGDYFCAGPTGSITILWRWGILLGKGLRLSTHLTVQIRQTGITHCTISTRNVHACTFLLQNGALWDMALVHCGIGAKSLGQQASRTEGHLPQWKCRLTS